jgi:hypothetical protein
MARQLIADWFSQRLNQAVDKNARKMPPVFPGTAVVSYLIDHLFRLPGAYWAPMSTLIALQSTLCAALLPVSAQYVAGTAIGSRGLRSRRRLLPPKRLGVWSGGFHNRIALRRVAS